MQSITEAAIAAAERDVRIDAAPADATTAPSPLRARASSRGVVANKSEAGTARPRSGIYALGLATVAISPSMAKAWRSLRRAARRAARRRS